MHGMICKSLEAFVTTTHGQGVWDSVRRDAGLSRAGFETMLSYDDAEFRAVLDAAAKVLDRSAIAVMEDMGTWICTHPPLEPVRRLFRFSGTTFFDFLMSLDEIDARARMAVPDLILPSYSVTQLDEGEFEVRSAWAMPGASGFLTGILRALADEYGALAMIEIEGAERVLNGWQESVSVRLVEESFHTPKAFSLGGAS